MLCCRLEVTFSLRFGAAKLAISLANWTGSSIGTQVTASFHNCKLRVRDASHNLTLVLLDRIELVEFTRENERPLERLSDVTASPRDRVGGFFDGVYRLYAGGQASWGVRSDMRLETWRAYLLRSKSSPSWYA